MGGNFQLSSFHLAVLITAILLSNFSTALDSGLSASSHVAIASAFNYTNLSTWPVNAFLITSMTVQPIYARISDHMGRRIPYLFASGIFAAGMILSSFSGHWNLLVAARALCGVGVGGVMIMGSVLLTDVVGLEKRGYYQSMNYVVYGAGSAIGSASGGALVQRLGWSWVYKCQIPVALLALLLLTCYIPSPVENKFSLQPRTGDIRGPRPGLRNFDWPGSICLSAFLISLFSFLTTGGNVFPWNHPLVLFAGFCTATFFGLLIYIETKAVTPVLPLIIFQQFPMRNLIVTGFLFSMINYMVIYNIPMFFQTVLLESPQDAGMHLIVPSISFTIVSALSASFIARSKSTALPLYTSQILLALGSAGLVVMVSIFNQLHLPSWIYNFMLIFPAVGASMMAPSALLTLLNLTEGDGHAVANAGFIMARSLGVFVATTLSAVTVQNSFRSFIDGVKFDDGMRKKVEEVRKNIDLISTLDKASQAQVIKGFTHAYTTLFTLCLIFSILIIFFLVNVKPKAFLKETEKGGPEMRKLMDEESLDGESESEESFSDESEGSFEMERRVGR